MIGKALASEQLSAAVRKLFFIVKQKNLQTLVNKGFASFLTCLADTKWMHI